MPRTTVTLALALTASLGFAPAVAAEPTPSPSATLQECPPYRLPTIEVITPTIRSGEPGKVRIEAQKGTFTRLYEKQAQDSGYRFLGSHDFDQTGSVEVAVTPRTNADYKIGFGGGGPAAQETEGCQIPYYDGETQPQRMDVASVLALTTATRTGTRSFVFSGTNKGHAGDLVNLYRVDASGRPVLTSQARTGTNGTYRIGRTFSGVGTFAFFVASPTDAANVAGESNSLRVQIR